MLSQRCCAAIALIFSIFCIFNSSVIAFDYNTYIYTSDSILILSYENDINFDIYEPDETLIYSHLLDPNGLDKGEILNLDENNNIFKGVYKISSSSPKYSVLVGDATDTNNGGICGFYAMDPNGLGVAKEFYTYVPRYQGRNERFIIFAYEDGTAVTVKTGNGSGNYTTVSSDTIDEGERMVFENPNEFEDEYLHVTADKPVSVLTAYDFGYLVPSKTGRWSGTKFYTCVNNLTSTILYYTRIDEQNLIVSAFDDDTLVTVTDTDTSETVWKGLVDSGRSYIKNFPENWQNGPKYYTIESDKTVSVTVAGPDKIHHQLLADRYGSGIGEWNSEVIGPTSGDKASVDNYLMFLSYQNNTLIECYDMSDGTLAQSFAVSAGAIREIDTDPSQWKIIPSGPVSVYSGIDASARAEFVPLLFDVKAGLPFLGITDVIENNAAAVDPTDPNANEITYTITYANDITDTSDPNYLGTLTDLELKCYLKYDTYAVTASPSGTFDLLSYSYSWNIGSLAPGQSGSVNFTVLVSDDARPLSKVINWAELSNDDYEVFEKEETPVACWGSETVYVDAGAKGNNDGTSWDNAYTSLYRAMDRVRNCNNTAHDHEIWVANGTYYTTHSSDTAASFELIEGVNIYGGFKGGETMLSQRDWNENRCILSGGIGGSDTAADASYVVTADSSITSATELDGFTITRAVTAGIYASGGYATVYNCRITGNHNDGIYIENAQASISGCVIVDNTDCGIYCTGTGSLSTDHCKIVGNDTGIDCTAISSVITNCWIYDNDDNGIEVGSNATVRNNTIISNGNYGLYKETTATPTIRNTIIWNNQSQLLRGWEADHCCVMNIDPNNFNINSAPGLAYDGYRDYHLSNSSPCIDAGDSTGIVSELDLDSENRIYGSAVDIGADEWSCEDVYNGLDLNADGIVNMSEFSVLAAAWDSWSPNAAVDPNDAINWNADCDFDPDEHIDTDDLAVLADNWLWQACWRSEQFIPMGMGMMSFPMEPAETQQQDMLELESQLLWFRMLNSDPSWSTMLYSEEWLQFMGSIETTLEAIREE